MVGAEFKDGRGKPLPYKTAHGRCLFIGVVEDADPYKTTQGKYKKQKQTDD